nr:MAG TPA: hypothetical protein [Caudoviricetes sp.]
MVPALTSTTGDIIEFRLAYVCGTMHLTSVPR